MATKGLKITSTAVTSKGEIANVFISIRSAAGMGSGNVGLTIDLYENEAAYDSNAARLQGVFYDGGYINYTPTVNVGEAVNIQTDTLYSELKDLFTTDYSFTIVEVIG